MILPEAKVTVERIGREGEPLHRAATIGDGPPEHGKRPIRRDHAGEDLDMPAAGERMCGFDTISISATPDRLRST